jgi:hypothetical protein
VESGCGWGFLGTPMSSTLQMENLTWRSGLLKCANVRTTYFCSYCSTMIICGWGGCLIARCLSNMPAILISRSAYLSPIQDAAAQARRLFMRLPLVPHELTSHQQQQLLVLGTSGTPSGWPAVRSLSRSSPVAVTSDA